MADAVKCAEFAMLAEGHRRAGHLEQAEQLARGGLDEHPDCAEGALVLALVLLDQHRDAEARAVISDWADTHLGVEVTEEAPSEAAFAADVSDRELDSAFESAETDREQVIDADAVAQRVMLETELDSDDEFASPDSSFATRTVADLLSRQGDEKRASQIRAMMRSTAVDTTGRSGSRKSRKIERLERWLTNVRGGMQ